MKQICIKIIVYEPVFFRVVEFKGLIHTFFEYERRETFDFLSSKWKEIDLKKWSKANWCDKKKRRDLINSL